MGKEIGRRRHWQPVLTLNHLPLPLPFLTSPSIKCLARSHYGGDEAIQYMWIAATIFAPIPFRSGLRNWFFRGTRNASE
jgi:hypothetical protein